MLPVSDWIIIKSQHLFFVFNQTVHCSGVFVAKAFYSAIKGLISILSLVSAIQISCRASLTFGCTDLGSLFTTLAVLTQQFCPALCGFTIAFLYGYQLFLAMLINTNDNQYALFGFFNADIKINTFCPDIYTYFFRLRARLEQPSHVIGTASIAFTLLNAEASRAAAAAIGTMAYPLDSFSGCSAVSGLAFVSTLSSRVISGLLAAHLPAVGRLQQYWVYLPDGEEKRQKGGLVFVTYLRRLSAIFLNMKRR